MLNLRFDLKCGRVSSAVRAYEGVEPHVVIGLDGAERRKLADIAPMASAAVLKRFFNIRDVASASVESVQGGLKLLSDSTYRCEADALKKTISTMSLSSSRR